MIIYRIGSNNTKADNNDRRRYPSDLGNKNTPNRYQSMPCCTWIEKNFEKKKEKKWKWKLVSDNKFNN